MRLFGKTSPCRLRALKLHAAPIQGFFDIPVDHLFASPVLVDSIREHPMPNLMVVSPAAGGVERARAFAPIAQAFLNLPHTDGSSPVATN